MTISRSPRRRRVPAALNAELSGREREVLNLLTHGLSNKEIGGKLHLSPFTVKNHLARIYSKLQVRSRTAAVIAYLRP